MNPKFVPEKQEIFSPKVRKPLPSESQISLVLHLKFITSCKTGSQPSAKINEQNLISRVEICPFSHSAQAISGWWPYSRGCGCLAHGVFCVWETISTATKQCHCSPWSLVMGKLWRCSSTAFCKNVPEVSNSFLRSTQFPHLPCLKGISSSKVSALGRVDWLQPNCALISSFISRLEKRQHT